MAERYRDRPFPAHTDYDRGDPPAAAESDPLAELARLIGQTDPFAGAGRPNAQVPPRASVRDPYQAEAEVAPLSGPPQWLQRANRQEIPQQEEPPDYPSSVHPLQRYAAAHPAPEPVYQDEYQEEPRYEPEPQPDPSRYDDALYGQLDGGAQPFPQDQAYAEDDAYAYQDGYDDDVDEPAPRRRGGMISVIAVLLLAVVGTGAAFAYRTYVGTPRAGEPPIIKADTSPTKIVPAPSDGSAKLPDRMAAGDGTEKIVPREEAPVDVNTRAAPRVVFPPLNQNGNPPSPASVAPGNMPLASAGNGTLPNNEPRKVKTLTMRGDQPDGSAVPISPAPPAAAKPAPTTRAAAPPPAPVSHNPPASANASANAPLALVPQPGQAAPAAEPRIRTANVNPVPGSAPGGGS